MRYTPRIGPHVSGCVQVENTDKKFLERIMNPNGARAVGASVNQSSVHSFVRILATFYGNSIANISMHAGIVAHGTTLPHPALLTLRSFPSYIKRLPRRAFLSRTRRRFPAFPPFRFPLASRNSKPGRVIGVQIRATLDLLALTYSSERLSRRSSSGSSEVFSGSKGLTLRLK